MDDNLRIEPEIDKSWFYNGIAGLRKAGVPYPYSQWQVDEIVKCSKDPIYFIKNYVKIVSLDAGVVNFDLWPWQEKMVKLMLDNRFTIFKIPRQSGKTTVTAAAILWELNFINNMTEGIVANKERMASEIVAKIKNMFINLPFWMQQGVKTWQITEFSLENGGTVLSSATSGDSHRGRSLSRLFWDEGAFVHQNMADAFLASIYPTIASSKYSKITISSTTKGYNHFAKFWFDSVNGNNSFIPMSIEWNEIPGRDKKFKEETIKQIGPTRWQQEFECQFISASDTLISLQKLQELYHEIPITTAYNGNMNQYANFDKTHSYVVCVDTSEGKGLDYHAVSVIDITTKPFKLVLTFKDNLIPYQLLASVISEIIKNLGDNVILVVESNTLGQPLLEILNFDLETNATMYSDAPGTLGIKQTSKTRKIGTNVLKTLVENDLLLITDYATINELYNFCMAGGKYQGTDGHNDDLVMTLVIFAYFTQTRFFTQYTNAEHSFIRDQLLNEKEKQMLSELPPFGYVGNSLNNIIPKEEPLEKGMLNFDFLNIK